jgi:hypothetical protein
MEMDEEKFEKAALWVGGIVAAFVLEALLLRMAQRFFPNQFPNPNQQTNPKVRR